MSDDNSSDLGVASAAEQDAVIDKELNAVVTFQLIGNYAFTERAVYDGLLRAAHTIRHGRTLDQMGR